MLYHIHGGFIMTVARVRYSGETAETAVQWYMLYESSYHLYCLV